MASEHYHLRWDHPEPYALARISEALVGGALILYPTDTVYALGCRPSEKGALDRLRAIKGDVGRKPSKPLTLLCPSLNRVADYAYVDDTAYKLMRAITPGPYTFLLRATKEVPKLVLNPKRKEVGLRVPDHAIAQALMARTGGLIISSSAVLPDGEPAETLEELVEGLEGLVDLVVTTDQGFTNEPSTMIDLTSGEHRVLREGAGMEALAPYMA